jgi:hypothetical protein
VPKPAQAYEPEFPANRWKALAVVIGAGKPRLGVMVAESISAISASKLMQQSPTTIMLRICMGNSPGSTT